MKAREMLLFLESEVHELREEMTMSDTLVQKEAIISELGDILFDTLMLEMLLRKEYGFGVHAAWDAAATKVERRTPYMSEWGDGITFAETVEEAEAIWQNVKQKEKQDEQKRSDSNGPSEQIASKLSSKSKDKKDLSIEIKTTESSVHNSGIYLRFQPFTEMIRTNLTKALKEHISYLCAGFFVGYFIGCRGEIRNEK